MSNNKISVTLDFNLLTLLFIALKLTNYIDWSWWWVIAPTWVPLSLYILFLILAAFAEAASRSNRKFY